MPEISPTPQTGGCSVCGRTNVGTRKDGKIRKHVHDGQRGMAAFVGPCDGYGQPPVATQFGVRYKPDGPVFAYASREKAEGEIAEYGYGVLVFQDRIEGDPDSGRGWFEVPASSPEEG